MLIKQILYTAYCFSDQGTMEGSRMLCYLDPPLMHILQFARMLFHSPYPIPCCRWFPRITPIIPSLLQVVPSNHSPYPPIPCCRSCHRIRSAKASRPSSIPSRTPRWMSRTSPSSSLSSSRGRWSTTCCLQRWHQSKDEGLYSRIYCSQQRHQTKSCGEYGVGRITRV